MNIQIVFDYDICIDDFVYTLIWDGDDDKKAIVKFEGKDNFQGLDESQVVEEIKSYAEDNIGSVSSIEKSYTFVYDEYIAGRVKLKENCYATN